MRLFDIIKRKSKESFAISNIIQQMFVEAGISHNALTRMFS